MRINFSRESRTLKVTFYQLKFTKNIHRIERNQKSLHFSPESTKINP
jgi:hypothetical protein